MASEQPEHSAGAVVLAGDAILVLFDHDGQAVLPKGHVESGETLEQAAVREVQEETGLVVEVGRRLCEVHHDVLGEPVKRKLVTYFLATVAGEPVLRLDEAHASARWVPVGELHGLGLKYTEDRRVLEAVVRLVGVVEPSSDQER